MLKVEQPVVFVTLVSESKVDTGAVLDCGPDEVGNDARDIEGQPPLGLLGHLLLLHRSVQRYGVALPQSIAVRPIRLLRRSSLEGHFSLGLELLLPFSL